MVKPKKILNDPKDSVEEFIQGLLLQYPNHLVKLENHNVILASHRTPDRVQILSGGGSGHEPSHAGWIGEGMLTGAICGGIFASPSVSSILAAIRTVHAASTAGVLLIVKNYTGDRLNFGMAAERANQQGLTVEMVVVADDCALPRTKGITGARGVAGTVLVHKIAGAAAAAGQSLSNVVAVARLAASRMGTLGIALDSVTVPGATETNDRLDAETIEIGLGIHGEAGMKKSPLLSANEMAREMITTIRTHGREVTDSTGTTIVPLFEPGEEVCLLVNNLGGTSNFELSILAHACVSLLESAEFGVQACRVMVGSFMTSFDMRGVSVTILNVSHDDGASLLPYIDAPTLALAWPKCDVWRSTHDAVRPSCRSVPEVVAVNDPTTTMTLPPVTMDDFSTAAAARIELAVTKLAEAEALLTQYDTIVGDGDCGMTMKRGATEILARLQRDEIPTDHPVPMLVALADAVSASMGGTSGILIELLLRKMGSTLGKMEQIGLAELSLAFEAGVQAVSLYGGAQVGSRTMLDALVPAATRFVATRDVASAARDAREGADRTALMKVANAGRSNYLSEDTLEGTPDPGAVAVAIVLEALEALV